MLEPAQIPVYLSRVKWPEDDLDYSIPTIAEVKKVSGVIPHSPLCVYSMDRNKLPNFMFSYREAQNVYDKISSIGPSYCNITLKNSLLNILENTKNKKKNNTYLNESLRCC
jgi:hypothetical protein